MFVRVGLNGGNFLVREDSVGRFVCCVLTLQLLHFPEPNFFVVIGEVLQLFLFVRLDMKIIFEYALNASARNIQLFGHLSGALARISLQYLFYFPHHVRRCGSPLNTSTISLFNAAGIVINNVL